MTALAGGCATLTDCAGGTQADLIVLALVVGVVLWLVLPAVAAAVGPEAPVAEPTAGGPRLDAFDLSLSPTAAAHAATRPYLRSRLLIQEIMDAAPPVPDPQGALSTVRWEVPGTFNGRRGTWELTVNTDEKVIYHFGVVG